MFVATLVLLFILIIINIGELLFQCDVESLELFRKFERINKKIIDSKWSKNLNGICLKENLWPTYTNLVLL